MNQKDTLTQYIESQLKSGVSADAILRQLVANGWEPKVVNEAIAVLTQVAQPVAAFPPVQPVQPEQQLQSAQPAKQQVNSVLDTPQHANLMIQPQSQAAGGTPQLTPESYGVIMALKDAVGAIKANLTGVSVMMVIGFFSTLIGFVAVVFVLMAFVFAGAAGVEQGLSATGIVPMLLLAMAVTILVAILPTSFSMSIVGLAVNDGADGKKSQVLPTISAGIRRMLRVVAAITLSALISMLPAVVAMVLIFIFSALLPDLSLVFFLLALVAIVAGPLLTIRLLIMPVVALLEDTPIRGLYSRTRHLMKDGGSIFVLRFMGLFFVTAIILSFVFPSESELEQTSTLTSYIVGIVGAVFYMVFGAVLIMFYRNRKAVRG